MKRCAVCALLLALILSLAACAVVPNTTVDPDAPQKPDAPTGSPRAGSADGPGNNTGSAGKTDDPILTAQDSAGGYAADYAEIAAALAAYTEAHGGPYRNGGSMAVDEEADVEQEAPAANNGMAETAAGGASGDYSQTNVQVESVDEGDVVKTDGRYIYMLRGGMLIIAEAAGAETRILSRTEISESEWEDGEDRYSSREKWPQEMFVRNGRAAVISRYYAYSSTRTGDDWTYTSTEYTAVDIYDVTDPAAPRLAAELGQDGWSMGSRLKDGTLYLVTNYGVYDYDGDDPHTFVPSLYRNGAAEAMAPGDIWIGPRVPSTQYAVVTAYDLEAGEVSAAKSMLGCGSTLYMNGDSIYLANSHYQETKSEPRTESVYTVVDYRYEWVTELYRFDVADGVELAAEGIIPGRLNNQFSMDAYEGNLRLVSTTGGYRYTVYTDEAMGFENYRWPEDAEDTQTNGLYILNADLAVLGQVEDLAPGERIYSARFDGNTAYFCTFRNVDPLFAVDVSDPAHPEVRSALKISGFSEYLHFWGPGRLLGAGYEADEETGRTGNMKLVMFNTENAADVTVKTSMVTDCGWSAALDNHRAFLIDPAKNLIAFPGDEGFYIFGYDESRGFYQRALLDLEKWAWDARGLYIGDALYIVGDGVIFVVELMTLTRIAEIVIV